MGIYDFVLIEPEVEIPGYQGDKSLHEVTWQTRAFTDSMYRLHVITEDGVVYRAKQNHEKGNGLVESHGETGSQGFLQVIADDEQYSGYPRECSNFDWYRIRYVGTMRITSQYSGVIYDVKFERHDIKSIERAEPTEPHVGDTVYDNENSPLEIVDVTDKTADEYMVKPEVTWKGQTISESQTVAEFNPEYPSDDRVVVVEPADEDKRIPLPWSRLTKNPSLSYSS
jgi:hypothetical protein